MRDSFWPELENIAKYIKFARVSLAAAFKKRRSPLKINFEDFPNRFTLINLFSPILTLTRRIIPAIIDLVRFSRRAISDNILSTLY
jgi:hypothetical protein